MPLSRLLPLSPLLALLSALPCLAQRHSELGSYVVSNQAPPYLIADFDDDGMDELVSISGRSGWVSAMSWRDGRWQANYLSDMSQTVLTTDPQIWHSDEGKKVLVLRGHGLPGYDSSLLFMEGWPLRATRTLSMPAGTTSALIADPDLDGNDDLLALTSRTLFGLDPVTGEERWQLPFGGDHLKVEQLDSDMPMEIVIFGGHTVVVDGLTHATEGFLGSQVFGRVLANSPNSTEKFWIGWPPLEAAVRTYDGASLVQRAERTDFAPVLMLSADVDGDALEEAVVVDEQYKVRVLTPSTLADKWSYDINAPYLDSVQSGDFRGVGRDELLLTTAWDVELINGADGQLVARSDWGGGSVDAHAIADVDMDGKPELITATSSGPSLVKAVDLGSAQIEWRYPSPQSPPRLGFNAGAMQVAQLDDDSALEVVMTSRESDGLRVVDGGTGNIEFESNTLMRADHPRLFDFLGDARKEIVFCRSGLSMSSNQVRVMVLRASDGAEVWRSTGVGGIYAPCSGLEYFPATLNHGAFFVLLSQGTVYGIDTQTGEIAWTEALGAVRALKLESENRDAILVIQSEQHEIVHLNPYTQQELLRYPGRSEAMAAVPDLDQYWLLSGNELSLRSHDGTLLEVVPFNQRIEDRGWYAEQRPPTLAASYINGRAYVSISYRGVVIPFEFSVETMFQDGFER